MKRGIAVIIVNLTQHNATQDQKGAGVIDLDDNNKSNLLTFTEIPTIENMQERAAALASYATAVQSEYSSAEVCAMIGGAPYFMPVLAAELIKHGIRPLYAFSERVVKERIVNENETVKVAVFRHKGFVEHYGK